MSDLDDEYFEAAENERRIANTIRMGTVAEVDVLAARVKIKTEDIITDWLPWVAGRAGTVSFWSPPQVGEQVVLLSPSGELAQGVVLPGVYQQSLPAPSQVQTKHLTKYPDGTTVEYDFETHALTVISTGSVNITAAELVAITCPVINLTGVVTIIGDFNFTGTGNLTGDLTHTGGNLSSHGVVLHTHKHGGVQAGGSQTGLPV